MSRYALIINGTVDNIVEMEASSDWTPPQDCSVVPSETARIGDTYDGLTFSTPHIAPAADAAEQIQPAALLDGVTALLDDMVAVGVLPDALRAGVLQRFAQRT
jgi:hypothetical protein